jgi:hypothetical protein
VPAAACAHHARGSRRLQALELLRGDDLEKVLRELRKAGYLPVTDDDTRPRNFRQTGRVAEPTVKPAQMPQDKQNKRGAKADATIDWERIAKEDDRPWSTPSGGNLSNVDLPSGAVKQPSLIPFLIKQAVRSKQCVEIFYQDAPYNSPVVHLIEPQRVTASCCRGANLPLRDYAALLGPVNSHISFRSNKLRKSPRASDEKR